MHKNPLEKIGLSKNESIIYNILLERGEMTPSQIALLSGLTRENTYNIAADLIEKRLAEKIPNRKIITYRLLDPTNLRTFVGKRKEEVETGEKVLNDIYPELANLFSLSTGKSGIAYFKGTEGIKFVFGGAFFEPKPKEILAFRTPSDSILEDYLLEHILEQTKKGISSKILAPKGFPIATKLQGIKLLREVKYINSKDFLFPAEISIASGKVFIVSYDKNKGAIVIDNPDIAETFTQIFNLIWKTTK